ncbi:DUF389 domain-containing protein [Altererythrobacter sp.]|uniref:DUF389 domain-containing protein n=1 Tax=Altererythrobacter sp. TaxID=1872480 RepID=UPI001B1D5987|nr:DUF389 domain-containing protein [Altererythrobacter sp.]MBO6609295.1 DUF389 domain-containing protein [Altererythrobacter sp.]MBO6640704.1 DUF389 domain-containing protein [Altererythrobacter sp.]MBO6708598.1 DUF389 domain-containing protein [Altererythrobacter sp.]MBO6945264.1 DUF389 domain-containing protein [Altererythrobacter sp.]
MSETPEPQPVSPEIKASESTTNVSNFGRVLFSWRRWWLQDVVGTVDQASVIAKRREDCGLTERYLFMTAMSGGIAILGLLLSSPAVVIGAMLLSPLMGPIMGLGFALAIWDYEWIKQSARSLAWGTVMAILLCALVVFFSPIQTITPEIAARTKPNLFDLGVAFFSALAGAYAMIRGREGTIVGVAIATALMPPLAVVGFGLATWNWTVFSGALLLYVTNLITIALTAWGMARLYGFRTALSGKQTMFQNVAVIAVIVALAIPLTLSLQSIAFETNAQRQVRGEILDIFDSRSRLGQVEIDFDSDPVRVDANVFTPQLEPDAELDGERALTRVLGRPVQLSINQVQSGRSAAAAQQAELSATRAREEAAALQRAEQLAERLSLVAGVSEDELTIDRQRRRAVVRARPLDGASLATYRELEMRIATTEPEWTIELTPPRLALPQVTFADGEPDEAGVASVELIVWAARRLNLPVAIAGSADEVNAIQQMLSSAGITVTSTVQRRAGTLQATWATSTE